MSASSNKFKQFKNTTAMAKPEPFTLTLIEATAAISTTGKWDSKFASNIPAKKASSPNSTPIKILSISNLPTHITKTLHGSWDPATTTLYGFIELLKSPRSKVEILDLTNHQFDQQSLLTLEAALKDKFSSGYSPLKIIKINKNLPALQHLLANFEELTKITKIKFEFVELEPEHQHLSKPHK